MKYSVKCCIAFHGNQIYEACVNFPFFRILLNIYGLVFLQFTNDLTKKNCLVHVEHCCFSLVLIFIGIFSIFFKTNIIWAASVSTLTMQCPSLHCNFIVYGNFLHNFIVIFSLFLLIVNPFVWGFFILWNHAITPRYYAHTKSVTALVLFSHYLLIT